MLYINLQSKRKVSALHDMPKSFLEILKNLFPKKVLKRSPVLYFL